MKKTKKTYQEKFNKNAKKNILGILIKAFSILNIVKEPVLHSTTYNLQHTSKLRPNYAQVDVL